MIFQKLELLIMVLRVLDISVLRFGKLYQHIKELDSIDNLLLKNGKQKLVHVGYFKSIYKIRLHIDLNINLLLCLHIFYKIVRTVLQQTCEMEIFAAAVNGFQLCDLLQKQPT